LHELVVIQTHKSLGLLFLTIRVIVADPHNTVLSSMSPAFATLAHQKLVSYGVELHLGDGCRVVDIQSNEVKITIYIE
jgi:hypothetical protein